MQFSYFADVVDVNENEEYQSEEEEDTLEMIDSQDVPVDFSPNLDDDEEEGEEEEERSRSQQFVTSKGITGVQYQVMDKNKDFSAIKYQTKSTYLSQNERRIKRELQKIHLYDYYCSKCDSDFSSESRKEQHICKPIEGDAINYAIKVVQQHLASGSIYITSVNSNNVDNESFHIQDLLLQGLTQANFTLANSETFRPCWAIRPGFDINKKISTILINIINININIGV